MSATIDLKSGGGLGGFKRWTKLPVDDLPLIRPPRHHMVAHITGGLTKLYDLIKEKKKDVDETSPENDKDEQGDATNNGPTNNGECNAAEEQNESSDSAQNKEKASDDSGDDKKDKNGQNEKKDDEGGGESKSKSETTTGQDEDEEMDEEEETTPYTDEEGEFSPEKGMPYLAGRYKYTNVLARGQSAIIIKVLDTFHKDRPLAIKVLHRVYKPIGSQEADILLELHRADPWLHVPFARLLNQFLYGPHYCLVFEYLSPTPLYNHYDQRDIREASSLPHVRDLTVKLLTVLGFLYKQNVIHADLKPENILLSNEDDLASVMVVDFGNALRNTDEELSLYYSDFELQTLPYRAPEVIFGMKFSLEVDMWSLGCLLAECYLGEPLFLGKSKKEILGKITNLLGPLPKEFSEGEYSKEFADFIGRPMSRYQRLENLRKRLNDCKDSTFLMLVERLLTYLPDRRYTPFEAACHPFVACSSPFLYLTPSPGLDKYPTILLDMSTYPYLPGLPDDEDENSASAQSRKRLASYACIKRPHPSQGQKDKEGSIANSNSNSTPANPPTNQTPTPTNPVSGAPPAPAKKDNMDILKAQSFSKPPNTVPPSGKTATRSDVKETLKSMGLRCEDFTISVYSREQAHAILRRQGVEVTPNNMTSRDKFIGMGGRGGYRNADMRRGAPNMQRAAHARTFVPARKVVPRYEEDDDDCVILDPPDMPKPSPVSLPQQFQLMGTTVQVNRGAKRPNRPMMNQPLAKRPNARPMQYYQKEHEDYGAEASVQDTLKRLKNYNISITCRRNATGYGSRGMMDSESDMDDGHLESDEEEEDMTKYLECQIGEIDDIPEQDIFDDEEIDCDDKDDVDYNPRGGKKKKSKNKSPRKGSKIVEQHVIDPASMLEQRMVDSDLDTSRELDSSNKTENDAECSESGSPEKEKEEGESNETANEKPQTEDEEKLEGTDDQNKTDETLHEGTSDSFENEGDITHESETVEINEDEQLEDGAEEDELEECEDPLGTEKDNMGDLLAKDMESSATQDNQDDEEIDAELEKELLAGDVEDEGDMEEDL
ncbi:hypothetical protein SK128_013651 [Halocaridina rubra]|uniref:Protein kinase domain-containing protein n=1 Tax=Halocaridina rubra TaxID=373956 RepID=A0AAN8WTU7_HALRR